MSKHTCEKVTVEELEAILSGESPGEIEIQSSGEVSVTSPEHTCGECEHFCGCHLRPAAVEVGVVECPARTSERELLMVLEAVSEIVAEGNKVSFGPSKLYRISSIINKAIQKAKGK